jgi:hypothetical protein
MSRANSNCWHLREEGTESLVRHPACVGFGVGGSLIIGDIVHPSIAGRFPLSISSILASISAGIGEEIMFRGLSSACEVIPLAVQTLQRTYRRIMDCQCLAASPLALVTLGRSCS